MLIIGEAERGKQIAAFLGLVPEEHSSGESRRLGHISKQGSGFMRFLLMEASQVTVRNDGEWRSKQRLCDRVRKKEPFAEGVSTTQTLQGLSCSSHSHCVEVLNHGLCLKRRNKRDHRSEVVSPVGTILGTVRNHRMHTANANRR